jgi:Spy/CpxP family protein refolding chaperone
MIKFLFGSVVFFVFIGVFPSSTFADKMDTTSMMSPDWDWRAGYETQYMEKELALDFFTAASVHEINLKYAESNHKIMTSDKKTVEKIIEVKKNSYAKDQEMEKVLTADQYKEYTEKKKEMMKTVEEKVRVKR